MFLGDTKNLLKSAESCTEFDRAIYLHNCDNTEQEAELVKLLVFIKKKHFYLLEFSGYRHLKVSYVLNSPYVPQKILLLIFLYFMYDFLVFIRVSTV